MAELEKLINANKKIYPIFYGLEPKDLVDEAKLKQWEDKWNRFNKDKAVAGLQFDIRKWRNCLAAVRSIGGSEFNLRTYAYPFINNTVVPAICEICRPQAIFFVDDNFIKGRQRIAQEIEDKFQNLMEATQNQESVKQKSFILGLYSMAGGGKTTLCKTMVDYYNERGYSGASYLLDLPSHKVECDALVPKLKCALKKLTNAREEILSEIEHFDQAIAILQQKVKGKNFFLAIDNVWKWSEDYVKKILNAIVNQPEEHEWDTNKAIRLIITARDKKLLEYLLNIKIIQKVITHVPTINNREALEFMKTHMKCKVDHHEIMLKAIVDGCFFNGSCNPLLLNIMAKMVEHEVTNVERVLKDCILQLEGQQLPSDDEDMDEQVISVPTKVYENLNKKLQNLFMNTVILYTICYQYKGFYCGFHCSSRILCSWVRMLANFEYEEDIISKLKELENHGMLSMTFKTEDEEMVDLGSHELLDINIELEIHDLFIEVGKRAAIKSKCYLLSDGLDQPEDLNHISVVLAFKRSALMEDFQSKLRQCSTDKLKFLVVQYPSLLQSSDKILKLRDHIGSNLHILLLSCERMHKITSLSSAPNLLYLHLRCCDNLQEIQDINDLHKLQELHVECIYKADQLVVPNLASCTNLRRLTLEGCTSFEELAQLGCPLSVEVLVLYRCDNLLNLKGLESLKSIQAIHISNCPKIEEFPNVVLPELKKLLLRRCSMLRRVTVGVNDCDRHLPSLQVLDLKGSGFQVLSLKLAKKQSLGKRVLSALRVLNPNMEELSIRVNMENAEAMKASFAVQGLLNLEIEVIRSVRDQSVFDEFVWPRNLRKLTLTMRGTLLNNLALVRNKLTRLYLSNFLSKAIENLPSLQNLRYISISNSSSMQILSIKAYLPKLLGLTINRSNMKVLRIVSSLPKLAYLDIEKCSFLEIISEMSTIKNLHTLHCFKCSQLKEFPNLSSLARLEKLYLKDCSQLKELPGLSSLTQLKSLNLNGCQYLNLTLEELTCLTNLEDLDIIDCKLKNGKVENLKSYLPNCQIRLMY